MLMTWRAYTERLIARLAIDAAAAFDAVAPHRMPKVRKQNQAFSGIQWCRS